MAEESQARIADDEPPARILIVDDIADNRTILGRRFQRRGFEIAEADSGRGALEMIARETFDVVLLDVMMPDMNGLEVLRRIREKHTDVQLPVIMVTGKTESQDIVEALTAGANDYITKPVDFAVALARVSTQVRSRQAEEQVRRANEALSRANEELERRIAERTEQLRDALAEAQAANRSKDEFLVIVSHELRTPLNGMIGMGQMLARTELSEQQRKMVGIVNASADQLHGVVADLLDTLDLTAGGLKLSPEITALDTIVEEAAGVAAAKAQAKGLAFSAGISKDAAAPIECDPQRLRQVLGKLLDNAVKFTEAGEVSLRVARAADALTFEVRDTGVGFDEETARRMFNPFEQADGSLTRRFGGVGLGLAICRGLVELMGGTITAESRQGEGSVFRVELPLKAQAAAA
ncbi:hybrid sensor histidine kinase/response regulator [Phenylobacterium sp.]|uniref:hybrid sensor histidine kinase/response regulator n=1 Tax=Phenylobacterium sp. TaxID=1871053 RepID=UPI002BF6871C|nr:response regulator [Phenylobacterium sp.]HVI31078.1 response regulator [Phenylobacterium sp.]